ncbi:MAG: dienelactone hydrolase family protein [Nitrospinaceae bacterium]|nr:dienelactone hydrolase family protein [Nitrospinaceae bacterium]
MKKIFVLSVVVLLSFVTLANAGIKTEEIEYSHNGTKLTGYLAYDDSKSGKRPGVLVAHEWWGHNDHARNRAKMLAEAGYTALALDMYGSGKLANHPQKAGEFMNAAFSNWSDSEARYNKAMKILKEHKTVDATRIGSIGFCFGGAVSIKMAKGGADLKGIVGFHSALPMEPAITKNSMKAAVLIINGSEDGFLKPETVAAFSEDMFKANVDFTYMNLRGVKHSYTNPQADELSKKFNIVALEYNKKADEQAWAAMLIFFKRVFN